ncbi:MAG TPA: hypothetical protein PKK99_14945 [Bacteroidia bacterium]|nr:hypothetical protein [Bacteroidia bacterium]HNQ00355.1 hypothetical protein [Bacteroidia bacterium]
MKVAETITINKNKSLVWQVISDIRKLEKTISGIVKIEILNEPSSELVGLKWRETRMYFGKPASVEKCITEAVENEFYKTRAEMDGFIFITTMNLSQSNEQTILTSTHETIPLGFLSKLKSLPMIFFKGVLKKAILQDLKDIKNTLESK